MARYKNKFVCSECGHENSGWLGRCPGCGSWNTLSEETMSASVAGGLRPGRAGWTADQTVQPVVSLSDVPVDDQPRFGSGLTEFDRVLGGGFVPGSLVLLGGDPGIGKSTLLLQSLAALARTRPVLYVSGEESPRQIRLRADRLGLGSAPINLLASVEFSRLADVFRQTRPDLLVVDSIQTLYAEELSSAPGSVSQVREVTAGLLRLAKAGGTTVVLVGHVTKDGSLAGPRVLEHMVDTVLYFEGDGHQEYRLLRAVKNRFGATDELGVFEMTSRGLIGVANASQALLAGRPIDVAGSVVTACIEGTRPLLVEIQALLTAAAYGSPQRMSQGLDRNRLAMILAVLDKHLRLGLNNLDTVVNVVGGLRLIEPASDLAAAAAILSSLRDQPVRSSCVVFGELGLTGEIRAVQQAERRIQEAARLGFRCFIVPSSGAGTAPRELPDDIDLITVDRLSEAVDILF